MSNISSIVKNSYPYHSTLAEIDTNGDGIVSRQEMAAAQRPGLLSLGDQSIDSSRRNLSSIMVAIMQLGDGNSSSDGAATASLPGSGNVQQNTTTDGSLQASQLAYKNTYGQYDLDSTSH